MVVHRERMIERSESLTTAAAAMAACAANLIAARAGVTVKTASAILARNAGVSAGTLENLSRGRIKNLSAEAYHRIRAQYVVEIEGKIRELELLLDRARAVGSDVSAVDLRLAENSIAAARNLIIKVR